MPVPTLPKSGGHLSLTGYGSRPPYRGITLYCCIYRVDHKAEDPLQLCSTSHISTRYKKKYFILVMHTFPSCSRNISCTSYTITIRPVYELSSIAANYKPQNRKNKLKYHQCDFGNEKKSSHEMCHKQF